MIVATNGRLRRIKMAIEKSYGTTNDMLRFMNIGETELKKSLNAFVDLGFIQRYKTNKFVTHYRYKY